MDVTTQRRCLQCIAAGLIAGTVGTAMWSVAGIDVESPAVSQRSVAEGLESIPDSRIASANDDAFADRLLRQPLYDPPPKPVPPRPQPSPRVAETPPQSPKLDLTLVGTIIQPDQSLAIVANASGEFDVKGIGESLELSPQGITIEQIESERVTLRYQGRESTIELDRSKVSNEGAGGNRGGGRRRSNR